jgi:hypothetical protein
VPLHAPRNAFLRLVFCGVNELRPQKHAEKESENRDHDRRGDHLSDHEMPSHEHDQDDTQFKHQVGGRHLECHGGREVRALAKDRSRNRNGRVGAGRGSGPECKRDADRARAVVW